eukprot:g5256.t1
MAMSEYPRAIPVGEEAKLELPSPKTIKIENPVFSGKEMGSGSRKEMGSGSRKEMGSGSLQQRNTGRKLVVKEVTKPSLKTKRQAGGITSTIYKYRQALFMSVFLFVYIALISYQTFLLEKSIASHDHIHSNLGVLVDTEGNRVETKTHIEHRELGDVCELTEQIPKTLGVTIPAEDTIEGKEARSIIFVQNIHFIGHIPDDIEAVVATGALGEKIRIPCMEDDKYMTLQNFSVQKKNKTSKIVIHSTMQRKKIEKAVSDFFNRTYGKKKKKSGNNRYLESDNSIVEKELLEENGNNGMTFRHEMVKLRQKMIKFRQLQNSRRLHSTWGFRFFQLPPSPSLPPPPPCPQGKERISSTCSCGMTPNCGSENNHYCINGVCMTISTMCTTYINKANMCQQCDCENANSCSNEELCYYRKNALNIWSKKAACEAGSFVVGSLNSECITLSDCPSNDFDEIEFDCKCGDAYCQGNYGFGCIFNDGDWHCAKVVLGNGDDVALSQDKICHKTICPVGSTCREVGGPSTKLTCSTGVSKEMCEEAFHSGDIYSLPYVPIPGYPSSSSTCSNKPYRPISRTDGCQCGNVTCAKDRYCYQYFNFDNSRNGFTDLKCEDYPRCMGSEETNHARSPIFTLRTKEKADVNFPLRYTQSCSSSSSSPCNNKQRCDETSRKFKCTGGDLCQRIAWKNYCPSAQCSEEDVSDGGACCAPMNENGMCICREAETGTAVGSRYFCQSHSDGRYCFKGDINSNVPKCNFQMCRESETYPIKKPCEFVNYSALMLFKIDNIRCRDKDNEDDCNRNVHCTWDSLSSSSRPCKDVIKVGANQYQCIPCSHHNETNCIADRFCSWSNNECSGEKYVYRFYHTQNDGNDSMNCWNKPKCRSGEVVGSNGCYYKENAHQWKINFCDQGQYFYRRSDNTFCHENPRGHSVYEKYLKHHPEWVNYCNEKNVNYDLTIEDMCKKHFVEIHAIVEMLCQMCSGRSIDNSSREPCRNANLTCDNDNPPRNDSMLARCNGNTCNGADFQAGKKCCIANKDNSECGFLANDDSDNERSDCKYYLYNSLKNCKVSGQPGYPNSPTKFTMVKNNECFKAIFPCHFTTEALYYES